MWEATTVEKVEPIGRKLSGIGILRIQASKLGKYNDSLWRHNEGRVLSIKAVLLQCLPLQFTSWVVKKLSLDGSRS
ncbi:hypothetical protein FNW02_10955 [Komarekiella sp. 'clone 1']|uniref:Uncharacterized protein n=1 Tax=Komarekiella delphini-convector SJRDD-AB1 TaxID=2593771 RepID=A0AA40SW39_9NOST|nr:hypothetical protein [Komarekiella delphini-convector]MBD6616343.1 hypothetical protein [Komarekiella delphini-convector SJRDD-AB1]